MRLLALSMLAVLAACASQPPAESPPAAPALAASSIPEAAPAAATESTATAAEDADEFKVPAGYKRKVVDGRILYCSKVVVLGSRFPKDDCRTQSQLEELEAQRASARTDMEQKRAVCGSAAGCGSF